MDWVVVLKDFGMPAMAVLALGYAIARTSVWVANSVLLPLATRHMAFLDRVEAILERQAKVLEDNQAALAEMSAGVRELVCDNRQRERGSG